VYRFNYNDKRTGPHNTCYVRTVFVNKRPNRCNISAMGDLHLWLFARSNYYDCTLPLLPSKIKHAPNSKEYQRTCSEIAKLAPKLPNNLLQNHEHRRTCFENCRISSEIAEELAQNQKKCSPNHQELAPKLPNKFHQSPSRTNCRRKNI